MKKEDISLKVERPISSFFDNEYSAAALYAAFSHIASYADGLKPSARKIIHTVRSLKVDAEVKVSSLAERASEHTKYIHGAVSLVGVIVGLAQDYVGANNIPMLAADGTFGSRFVPEAAAARYIHTKIRPVVKKLFREEDDAVLISQEFEGEAIEPRYFLPIVPMLLVNGSDGIGNGYAQKILPRDPPALLKALDLAIQGKRFRCPPPAFKGFTGEVVAGEGVGSWEVRGRFERVARGSLRVTELPIGQTLAGYNERLEALIEKKIIKDKEDLSENDRFSFDVKVSLEFMEHDDDWILDKLGLVKRVTENYTCFDENNTIHEFETPEEIILAYVELRKKAYLERKRSMLVSLSQESDIAALKARFIRDVIRGEVKLANVSTVAVEKRLEELGYATVDDGYDYLLGMPMRSLTKERALDLEEKAEAARLKVSELRKKNETDLWKEDLAALT